MGYSSGGISSHRNSVHTREEAEKRPRHTSLLYLSIFTVIVFVGHLGPQVGRTVKQVQSETEDLGVQTEE